MKKIHGLFTKTSKYTDSSYFAAKSLQAAPILGLLVVRGRYILWLRASGLRLKVQAFSHMKDCFVSFGSLQY